MSAPVRKTVSGQITVFLALISLLIFGLLTGSLEGAREAVLRTMTEQASDAAMESLFAAFHSEMLEQYGLLVRALDEADSWTGTVQGYAQRTLSPGEKTGSTETDRIRLQELTVKAESAVFLTDDSGLIFEEAALAYMKTSGLAVVLQEVLRHLGLYDASGSLDFSKALEGLLKEENTDPESLLKDYDSLSGQAQALKQEQEAASASSGDGTGDDPAGAGGGVPSEADGTAEERPLSREEEQTVREAESFWETLRSLKENGLVTLITGETELSSLKWEGESLPSALPQETRQRGSGTGTADRSWDERLLLCEFMLHSMSCYTDGQKQGHRYEAEYVLTGKATEAEALRAVVVRLLALRSGLDLMYLLTDSTRMAEAEALAILLFGSFAPALIPGMKYLLLAVWALTEGASDVRRLLQGKQLPLWKDAADWRMSLLSLEFPAEADSSRGLGYEDYLRLLFYLSAPEDCSYRMMDVIQTRLGGITLSSCLVRASCTVTARCSSLYMVIPPFDLLGKNGWTFTYKSAYGY